MKSITLKSGKEINLNQAFNVDCLDFMKELPDKCIDLVLTDPPYGIGISKNPIRQKHDKKEWDNKIPEKEIFEEMFRISKDQIIWGGNYFNLPKTQGFLVWDKVQPEDFSLAMCEYGWMSFQKPAKIFKQSVLKERDKIHPTQKALKLFKWCLEKYAPKDAIVFDPFLGSFTTAAACHHYGLQWLGCEKDEDYFKSGYERYNRESSQIMMDFA